MIHKIFFVNLKWLTRFFVLISLPVLFSLQLARAAIHSPSPNTTGIPIFAANFPHTLRKFLTEALETLYKIQGSGSTPLHQKIFGGSVNGEIYRKWISRRIQRIEMLNDGCGYTAKINSDGEPGVVYVSSCVNQDPGPDSQGYWISTLIHEGRHLDPQAQYHRHEIGLNPITGFIQAFDTSELGAFSTELIWSHNLLNYCGNCKPDLKGQIQELLDSDRIWRSLAPAVELRLRSEFGQNNL